MAYRSISIKQAVLDISDNKYLLPVIQREMVWDDKKIESLFDSILSGYPFGSMLFWKYKIDAEKNYKFYEFIKCYDEYNRELNHNHEYDLKGRVDNEITAILDGQQRLTSLYIGLKGYMNLCKPRIWKKYREYAENYDKKYLYLNLLYKIDENASEDDDVKPEYEFKFKTEEQARVDNENYDKHLWFKVGEILDFNDKYSWKEKLASQGLYDTSRFDQQRTETIDRIFSKLWDNFCDREVISYFEETDPSFDRVLKIFVRINQGGTPLSYTDLLMSMLVNQWSEGREEINESIDSINRDYNFDLPKDIFLRACLYLTDAPIHFKADNFKRSNVVAIHDQFKDIVSNLRLACRYFNKIGYSKDNLRSNLILLPLALYFSKRGISSLDYDQLGDIRRWVQISVLSGAYGGQTNAYLTSLRNEINWSNEFPLQDILEKTSLRGVNIRFDRERITDMVDKARKGSQDAFTLLSILYPNKNYEDTNFHEDHIYPRSKLSKEQLSNGGDFLANLQLLKGSENEEKLASDPQQWLEKYFNGDSEAIRKYKEENYIPDMILSDSDFDLFISRRRDMIINHLEKVLS